MTRDEQVLLLSMLESFIDSGLIGDEIEFVKGGKEATVFRCRGGGGDGGGAGGENFFAAKVYRPRQYRRFRDDADYQNGRVILDARARRAAKKRTGFGQKVHQGLWVASEYQTQRTLFGAGADVPRPIECNGDAILMEWIGDDAAGTPAPQLKDVKLHPSEARPMFQRLMRNIENLLAHNCVHGDLSPFNILVREGQPMLIDFPQAVDPRMNRNAYMLLHRDVDNLCRHFSSRYALDANATRIAGQMWSAFTNGRL